MISFFENDMSENNLAFSPIKLCLGQVPTNANTTPSPSMIGARHRLELSDLDATLIKGLKRVSSTVSNP